MSYRSSTEGRNETKKIRMSFIDLLPTLEASLTSGGGLAAATQSIQQFLLPITSGLAPGDSQSKLNQIQEVADAVEYAAELAAGLAIGSLNSPWYARIPGAITLYINPQEITVDQEVLYNKMLTKGGFVIQFWGNDLPKISVKAKTTYFEFNRKPLVAFEILRRHVFQKRFSEKEAFRGMPIISMLYENQVLYGYLTDFHFSLASTSPYIVEYNFNFTVTKKLVIPIVSNLNRMAEMALPTDWGKRIEQGWGVSLG